MAIRVIVELRAEPGGRDELQQVFERMLTEHGPSLRGYRGSTRYEVLDDPDLLVEIADWESVEAREAHLADAAATGAYAPLVELVAAPFRVSVLSELPSPGTGDDVRR